MNRSGQSNEDASAAGSSSQPLPRVSTVFDGSRLGFGLLFQRGVKMRMGWLWLTLIVALGLWLRADALRQGAAFAFDYGLQNDSIEAYDVAVNLANGDGRAMYIGQPNFNDTSKIPGPLWAAFCAIGIRLFGGVEGAAFLVLISNTFAIVLTYLLTLRTVDSGAALLAALLQATSSTAIYFSGCVYNPCVMPLLGALLFLALWRVVQRNNSRAIFWVCFILLVMPQFHLSGLLLVPTVGLALWLSRRRLNLVWLSFGLVGGMLLYLPYIIGEMGHHWENTRGMTASGPDRYSLDTLKVFTAPVSFLLNYWMPKWQYTPTEYDSLSRACFGSGGASFAALLLSTAVALSLTGGAILLGVKASRGLWRSPRDTFDQFPGVTFLVVVLVAPLACAFLVGQHFSLRYALAVMAPLYGLSGAAAAMWMRNLRFRLLFTVLFVAAIGSRVYFLPRLFDCQRKLSETAVRFVPSFRNLEHVFDDVTLHAGNTRKIELRDQEYLRSLSSEDYRWLRGAGLIRRYMEVRYKEQSEPPSRAKAPAIYELRRAMEVESTAPGVVFWGNGIAIVAVPSEP
jgi:hypothetical protein